MIKSIPTQDEMSLLAKNIYETSSKMNGSIQITSLDDAANFAAYLYGFSSWKEYHNIYKEEYESKPKEEFVVKIPKFKIRNYKKTGLFFSDFRMSSFSKDYSISTSNVIPLEWLLGKKRNVLAKIDEPVGLVTKDYIITGSPLDAPSSVLNIELAWLIKYKQSFVLFGVDGSNKDTIDLLDKNNITKLGKNNFKIDPIEESFENEGFEVLLDIKPFGENYVFPWIWTMMVRTLRDELKLKWNVKKLLESLTIENLLQITERIKTVNPLIAKPLSQYLFKQCGVSIDNDEYIISEEGQAKHYHQIYLIKEKLEKLEKLYDLGYFSDMTNVSLKKHVFEKKSVVFLNCEEDKFKKLYWDACNVSYLSAVKRQNKEIANLDSNQYKVWGIWWSAENILSEQMALEIMDNSETTIIGLYVLSANHMLDYCFSKIKQIVFLKQYFSHYPEGWIKRALHETESWEDNLWFENFKILKDLTSKEAYIWKAKSLLVPSGIETFEFKKIELYSNEPI